MSYIGNTATNQAFTPAIDYFSGNASTTAFTLSKPVASVAQVQVVVNNVAQNPSSAYTVSSNTITFTSAPSAGTNNIYVYYTSPITQLIAPSQGTVTSSSFGAITDFTTTGNTILGDASTDTLTVGVTGIVKDASGNVGIGTASPTALLTAGSLSDGTPATYGGTIKVASETQTSINSVGGIELNVATGYSTKIQQISGGGANLTFCGRQSSATWSEYMRIDPSGRVGINTTTTSRAILNIDTDGSNNASGYGLALTNTAGGGATWTLQCGDQGVANGSFTIRQTGISGTTRLKIGTDGYLTVAGVYALTTGSAANVFVDSNGVLQRSTSSLKYKKNVQDATHGLADVLKLRPVTYEGKSEADEGKTFGGFIAEEIHEAGLTEFVQYADDGSPDALAYGNMVSLLAKAIQEQQALITALTARITALENK